MTVRALLIDDDTRLAELLRGYLAPHDVALAHAPDGARGLLTLESGGVDVVLLDVMMPGLDGLDVLRRLRQKSAVPVLMLTARGDETDRIVGLEVGADDYLPKPVSPRELLARIRAVLRRRQPQQEQEEQAGGVFTFEGWTLDLVRRVLRDPAGVIITLSEGEFSLLRIFTEKPQRVLSRDQLLELARGPDSDAFDRAIDTQVSRLRRKL